MKKLEWLGFHFLRTMVLPTVFEIHAITDSLHRPQGIYQFEATWIMHRFRKSKD